MSPSPVYLAGSAIWLLAIFVSAYRFLTTRRKYLNHIRGPKSGSWLYGHQVEFNRQEDVGQLDFSWNNEYGGAWRIDDCYGGELLMVADPKAINHILHTGGYGYPKTRVSKQFVALAFGRGVSWATGDQHVRHRKLMNPAFTPAPLREFYHVFRHKAAMLSTVWRDKLQEGGTGEAQNLEISRGLANTTLDIIGEAVFDYSFNSLDGGEESEFSRIFHNLWADSNLFPSPFVILFTSAWQFVPESILRIVEYLPFRQFLRFRQFLTTGKGLGKNLILEKEKESALDPTKKHRDILSILVAANKNVESKNKLGEDEILSQITTLLFAGHETTATTLTWLMYELAHHPADQDRVREEIAAKRAQLSAKQIDFAVTDLDNMPFVNACIKEVLRYHPISPWVTRQADMEDVIPLGEPIIGVDGRKISQIEVGKGLPVLVSTCAYNRLKSVWGEDADQWNPSRFMNPHLKDNQISLGQHANLLTFSGGVAGCIGYKFALLEMQSTVVELIENFEFRPPVTKEKIEMLRVPIGAIMAPMIKGKFEERTQMPLSVTSLR